MKRIPSLLRSSGNLEPSKGYYIQAILLLLVTCHLEKILNQQAFLHLIILGLPGTQYLGLGIRFVIQLLRLGMLLKMWALRLESHLMETLWG